jgi:hypothetical protein
MELGTRIEIRPGLVMYGARLFQNATSAQGVIQLRGVDVFRPRATLQWLKRDPGASPAADIQHLAGATAHVLPQGPLPPGNTEAPPVTNAAG